MDVVLNNLTTIPDLAFANLSSLRDVTLSFAGTAGAMGAANLFQNTQRLREVSISNVNSIPADLFTPVKTPNIAEVTLVMGYTTPGIANGTFRDLPWLTKVVITGAHTISERAFENAVRLHTVQIDSVQRIETHAFAGCRSLTYIELPGIPGGPTSYGLAADSFINVENLREVHFDNNRPMLGGVFTGSTKNFAVVLTGAADIAAGTYGMFRGMGAENPFFVIQRGGTPGTIIVADAFSGYNGTGGRGDGVPGLVGIRLESATTTGISAFEGCTNLEWVIFEGQVTGGLGNRTFAETGPGPLSIRFADGQTAAGVATGNITGNFAHTDPTSKTVNISVDSTAGFDATWNGRFRDDNASITVSVTAR